jgi:hypothetical protein
MRDHRPRISLRFIRATRAPSDAALVQPELAAEGADFRRLDQAGMRHRH